jgi:predicted RNase H-like HicB family nuclease
MIEVLKKALTDAKRNERHNNVAETRYWLNQYKLIAEQVIAELESQEPVAIVTGDAWETGIRFLPEGMALPPDTKLYTTPPQRTEQEPVAWHELCRRLYVELFHCDQQMMATLDKEGDPVWQQGATVRDVLANAKTALETFPPQRTWVGLTVNEIALINADYPLPQGFAKAIEAKLKEKNT